MEKKQEKDLKIPTNNPDREEIISGIGYKEVAIIVVMFIICIFLTVIIYMIKQSLPAGILVSFFIMALTFLLVIKDRYGENMIDKVRIMIRYLRMQKKYMYKKKDIFGELEDE